MPFKPGQSGNPAGRPKGSRDALTEKVYKAMLNDWAEHGDEVVKAVRAKKPELYLNAVIRMIPMAHDIQVDDPNRPVSEYSVEELAAIISQGSKTKAA